MLLKRLGAGLLAAALAAPVFAQVKPSPNLDSAAKGQPGGATALVMAHDLFALGMANKDALNVLAAARLAASVEITQGAAADRATLGDGAKAVDDGVPAPLTAGKMMAAAKALAGEDEALLDLIETAEAEIGKALSMGAVRRTSLLAAGMTDVWKLPFFGGSHAEVAVIGDGGANLDVQIGDDANAVICADHGWSDRALCDFVPARNGFFYIEVHNVGDSPNAYHLLTN